VDFVKLINKLPADQDGEWLSIPFALIRWLQEIYWSKVPSTI
jgi:hypothetical protein